MTLLCAQQWEHWDHEGRKSIYRSGRCGHSFKLHDENGCHAKNTHGQQCACKFFMSKKERQLIESGKLDKKELQSQRRLQIDGDKAVGKDGRTIITVDVSKERNYFQRANPFLVQYGPPENGKYKCKVCGKIDNWYKIWDNHYHWDRLVKIKSLNSQPKKGRAVKRRKSSAKLQSKTRRPKRLAKSRNKGKIKHRKGRLKRAKKARRSTRPKRR